MRARTTEKRGRLVGGAASEEVLSSSRSVLHPNRAGTTKGLQQIFTEPQVAAFIAEVVGGGTYQSHAVLDLSAGNGALLAPYPERLRYGVEIDTDQVSAAHSSGKGYNAIEGDVQRAFPLLRGMGALFPIILLNPPFSLEWEVPGLAKGSSTYVAMRMAKRLLAVEGLGVLITGKARFERECKAELEAQLFALVEVETLFVGVDLPCVIAFWRESVPTMPGIPYHSAKLKHFAELAGERDKRRKGSLAHAIHEVHIQRFGSWYCGQPPPKLEDLRVLREELAARREERAAEEGRSHYLVHMRAGKMRVRLSTYAQLTLSRRAYEVISWVHSFDKQPPSYFALQQKEWRRLCRLAEESGLEVEPAVVTAVQAAQAATHRAAIPMYPLPEVQRLGFLEDADSILCKRGDSTRGFVEGERYELFCSTRVLEKTEQREVVGKDGEPGVQEVLVSRKAMDIRIGTGGGVQKFTEAPEDLAYLLEHFETPDPGDVASAEPAKVAYWLGILDRVEEEIRGNLPGFRFRWFQRQDLARGLVKGCFVLAWEQGLGKALGQLAYVRALELGGRLPDGCALFAMPQDLARQFAAEAKRFFNRELLMVGALGSATRKQHGGGYAAAVRRWEAGTWSPDREVGGGSKHGEVSAHEVYQRVWTRRRWLKAKRLAERRGEPFTQPEVPAVWAVTWYEVLAVTGRVDEAIPPRYAGWVLREVMKPSGFGYYKVQVPISTTENCPMCRADVDVGWNGRVCKARLAPRREQEGKGESTYALNMRRKASGWYKRRACGHVEVRVRRKPAYQLLRKLFQVVCVDEGTKIKGNDSLTSKAVRAMRAKYKLVASGTPQKNFVVDLFWLLYWALGDSSPRFPYAYRGGRERFTKDFAVVETVLEREGNKVTMGRQKVLPEVSNLLRLWKLLCSSVLRRRMDEVGCVVNEGGAWVCQACKATNTANTQGLGGDWRKPEVLECSACSKVFDAIVPLTFKVVKPPWGKAQKRFHAAWLSEENFVRHFAAKHPNSPVWQMGEGMVRRMAACLGQLAKLDYATTDPCGDPDPDYKTEELSPWTPQRLQLLRDVEKAVRAGGRCMVGSCMVGLGPWVAEKLRERGIRAAHITEEGEDGKARTLSPKVRATAIADFRAGKYEVLCVGILAVSLGHNLDCVTDVFADGLPWDFATWDQFLKRARRLSSTRPVTVHVYYPEASLGEKKWGVIGDKTDASDLVLDGRIATRRELGVDKVAILQTLQEAGVRVDGTEVPEAQIQALWQKGESMALQHTPAATPLPPRRRALAHSPPAQAPTPTTLPTPPTRQQRHSVANPNQGMLLPQYTPRFRTIHMDPPWEEEGGGGRGAQNHYELIPTEDMPKVIRESGLFLPYENAHLYMWATNNFLAHGLWLIEQLGFRYVTNFVWVKPRSGLGQYARGKHELLLFAVRGKGMSPEVLTERRDISTVIQADYVRDIYGQPIHSAKPPEAYQRVEERSNGPYLDMFARGAPRSPQWTVWGNQAL